MVEYKQRFSAAPVLLPHQINHRFSLAMARNSLHQGRKMNWCFGPLRIFWKKWSLEWSSCLSSRLARNYFSGTKTKAETQTFTKLIYFYRSCHLALAVNLSQACLGIENSFGSRRKKAPRERIVGSWVYLATRVWIKCLHSVEGYKKLDCQGDDQLQLV